MTQPAFCAILHRVASSGQAVERSRFAAPLASASDLTIRAMLERAQTRALPLLNKGVADMAPAAQACCGACRTCVTTNVLTLATGAAVYAAAVARRFFARAP